MVCPFCLSDDTKVYNSRAHVTVARIWRRRRCMRCQETFTTYEAPDMSYLRITKRSGDIEPYARIKLFTSIYRAHLDPLESDALAATVEQKLLLERTTLLSSGDIARVVQSTLQAFAQPTYARYQSYQPPK